MSFEMQGGGEHRAQPHAPRLPCRRGTDFFVPDVIHSMRPSEHGCIACRAPPPRLCAQHADQYLTRFSGTTQDAARHRGGTHTAVGSSSATPVEQVLAGPSAAALAISASRSTAFGTSRSILSLFPVTLYFSLEAAGQDGYFFNARNIGSSSARGDGMLHFLREPAG